MKKGIHIRNYEKMDDETKDAILRMAHLAYKQANPNTPTHLKIWESELYKAITQGDNENRIWCALMDKEGEIMYENEQIWKDYFKVSFAELFGCLSFIYEIEGFQKEIERDSDGEDDMLYFPTGLIATNLVMKDSLISISSKIQYLKDKGSVTG